MAQARQKGNWTPDGEVDRAALRRDYAELTPAQRVKQVFEISRFMSRMAKLAPAAIDADVDGRPIKVVGYKDLIALKTAAGRPEDLTDLQRLRQPRSED